MADNKAKSKLKEFAKELRKLSQPYSPISVHLSDFVATAIEGYLSEKYGTMDQAFGLTRQRGRPVSKEEEHLEIARQIDVLKEAGNSWEEIAGEMQSKLNRLNEPDVKHLKEIYDKNFTTVRAEQTIDAISEDFEREMEIKPKP